MFGSYIQRSLYISMLIPKTLSHKKYFLYVCSYEYIWYIVYINFLLFCVFVDPNGDVIY